MELKEVVKRLKNDPKEAVHYIVGNTLLFMNNRRSLRWLLPFHVRFWFEYRKIRAERCLNNGECICCGCEIPGLYFSTKGCNASKYRGLGNCDSDKKTCYPKLYNKERTLIFLRRSIKLLTR